MDMEAVDGTDLKNSIGQSEMSAGVALVIGAGGGLGAALVAQLSSAAGESGAFGSVLALSRGSAPAIDYGNEASLSAAAQWVAVTCAEQQRELRLLIVASGFLHGPQGQPERSFAQLDAEYLGHVFQINAIGPALVMKHFLPLLPKQGRCVAAVISARVGSIGSVTGGDSYQGDRVEGDKNVRFTGDQVQGDKHVRFRGDQIAGGKTVNDGTVHVSGGTVYGAVTGTNIGTINHNAAAASPSVGYELTIDCAPLLQSQHDHEVVVRVSEAKPGMRYRLDLRAPGISQTCRFTGNEAAFYITPPAPGPLRLRATLYEADDNTQIASVSLMVQVQ